MNVVYNKRDYILPFKKYLNKPKKSVSFEQKVEYEFTYGKDAYDRKPIENVEQITLRELYELTLSRVEARKSNVYYSNQKPKNENSDKSDISECINDDSISEENKVKLVSKAEQEKINNMEVDELEKSKGSKKIKLDFSKANLFKNNAKNNENKNDDTDENKTNDSNTLIQKDITESLGTIKENEITLKEEETELLSMDTEAKTEKGAPTIENSMPQFNHLPTGKQSQSTLDPRLISPRSTSNEISTFKDKREHDYLEKEEEKEKEVKKEQNQPQPQLGTANTNTNLQSTNINGNETENGNGNGKENTKSPMEGGEINNKKNLPGTFVSPKRTTSKNRMMIPGIMNPQLDLAHYKPPIKSLEAINDPNYEEKVGSEPVPYGSSVYYEEPEATSPNMDHAIPSYHRPMMDYRNNLMNITNYNEEMALNYYQSPEVLPEDAVVPGEEEIRVPTGHEKKSKDKKSNRKSLGIFNILKKSKSADNIKMKSRMSFFKPTSKSHSIPNNANSTSENKTTIVSPLSSSPLAKTQNISNNNKSPSKNIHSRISVFNKFQEPTIDDLIAEGPGLANNENKPMSNYALKTLKLRQSDSSLHVNSAKLHIKIPSSPNHLRPVSPLSAKSYHSPLHSPYRIHSSPILTNNGQSNNELDSHLHPYLNPHSSPKDPSTVISHELNTSKISPTKPTTYVPNIPLD
ncbi:hypothetical protein H8356DRAFT_1433134 [Neocallimastix lanati (nom. inval.)]|jgi:hypothetical protein|nr:hypothetical protein H8356DRAFT_1433134 [Neocallimastix sp. JGI-2020a]